MTITYRFFYETFVIKSKILKEFLEDKLSFIGLINIYHKDKFIITEENKNSKELFAYAENLLDCEFIFFEFVFEFERDSSTPPAESLGMTTLLLLLLVFSNSAILSASSWILVSSVASCKLLPACSAS